MIRKIQNPIQNIDLQENILYSTVEITILLALAGVPLIIVPFSFDYYYFPKVIAIFILEFCFIIMFITNKLNISTIIKKDNINIILFIYFILLLTSLAFTKNIEYAIFGGPGRIEGLITIVMYMFLFTIARSMKKTNIKFLYIIMCTAMIISIYGIIQTLGLDPIPRDTLRIGWNERPFSTLGNPNYLGAYLVLIIPFSIFIYIFKNKIIGLVFYSIMLYCLLTTNTRSSWLGAMTEIICFIVLHIAFYKFNKNDEFEKYFILLVISIIIILIYNYLTDGNLINRFLTISTDAKELLTNGEKADFTGSNRGFIWKRTIELIIRQPLFGFGLENLGETFTKFYSLDILEAWGEAKYIDRAHNEYLHIAVSTGIPSLIVYLSFVFLVIKKGIQKVLHNQYLLIIISSVLGYLTTEFFSNSIVSVAYIYWIFLGLIASYN